MDKENVIYIHSRVIFNYKEEEIMFSGKLLGMETVMLREINQI
jgi:hypothetical protein